MFLVVPRNIFTWVSSTRRCSIFS